jgi:hypothetical protein
MGMNTHVIRQSGQGQRCTDMSGRPRQHDRHTAASMLPSTMSYAERVITQWPGRPWQSQHCYNPIQRPEARTPAGSYPCRQHARCRWAGKLASHAHVLDGRCRGQQSPDGQGGHGKASIALVPKCARGCICKRKTGCVGRNIRLVKEHVGV